MLGRVVCGSRTWICTMAAPALAASIEERAICSGLTGTAGFLPGESAEPGTAHEFMTLRCMLLLPGRRGGRAPATPILLQSHRDVVDQSRAAEPGRDQEADGAI